MASPNQPTLALLHGTMCDGRLYAGQAGFFERRGWRVRLPAVLGHAEGLAGRAAAILAGLPERFALAGLSLGGIVAMEILRQAPGRVTHLALLDTNDAADSEAARSIKSGDYRQARKTGLRPFMEQVMAPRYLHPDRHGDEALRAAIVDMALDQGMDVWQGQIELIEHRASYRDTLASYDGPALVACGSADTICAPEVHREMGQALGVEPVLFEGCGHLPTIEDPDAVCAALEQLLQSGENTDTQERKTA